MALDFYQANKVTPRQNTGIQQGKTGYLTNDQLLDPSLGFGSTYQAAARQAGTNALQGAMSQANPEDLAAQKGLRDYYTQSLQGLGRLGDLRGTALDTQMQTGLGNLLQQYKNQNAGTGRIGSSQYGRGQGDITQRIASEYSKGLADLSGQQLQNAGQIGQGLGSIYGQDLQERAFQQQQAQNYANYLAQQQGIDANRDQGLAQLKQQQDAANQAFWGNVIQAGATIGGAAIAGPAGGMIGSQLAGGMTGGGSGVSGQTSGGGSTAYKYPTVGQSYGYY